MIDADCTTKKMIPMQSTATPNRSLPALRKPRLDSIESLRAVAALMVVFYHLAMLANIQSAALFPRVKQYFGNGVPLFYALSGFVLSFGYIDNLGQRNKILYFYVRRYFRIAPLFYLMCAIWIVVSKAKWNADAPAFSELILNALMLFGLVPSKHESIAWAGWSIGVEVLFYLVFPIVAALICNLRSAVVGFLIVLLVSSSYFSAASEQGFKSYGYMNLVTHLPSFLVGVLSYKIWAETGFALSRRWGVILLFSSLLLAAAVVLVPGFAVHLVVSNSLRLDLYVWSIVFMMLILSLCLWPTRILVNRVSSGLGRISFSLYLWHPLVIVMLLHSYRVVESKLGIGELTFIACGLLTTVVLCLIASVSFRFVEKPGMRFGRSVAAKYSDE